MGVVGVPGSHWRRMGNDQTQKAQNRLRFRRFCPDFAWGKLVGIVRMTESWRRPARPVRAALR